MSSVARDRDESVFESECSEGFASLVIGFSAALIALCCVWLNMALLRHSARGCPREHCSQRAV
jgi:hypothetical protein